MPSLTNDASRQPAGSPCRERSRPAGHLRILAIAASATAALAALTGTSPAVASDWLPVSAEEVAMTSVPEAPNVPAVYLYRQVDRNDEASTEYEYRRIKILTEEGRKYADVKITFIRGVDFVRSVQARVIHPDGKIVDFNGTVYEQTVIKARGARLIAKTFTLPDVQVGSIIEYSYRRVMPEYLVYDSHWMLNEDLFTKHAKFSLVKNPYLSLKWSWPLGLPDGAGKPTSDHGTVRLEASNIPAFVAEEAMPPESALKFRIDFVYSSEERAESDPAEYWKQYGKERYKHVLKFIDERRTMERALAETVAPDDSADTKLHKIYERVQRMRNISYEEEKTEQEQKREKRKDNDDVEDVWKHGYGDGQELTWLFLALARTAGLDADPVYVSTRDQYFFQSAMMNSTQLNTNVVRVKLDGKELFLDPGTKFAPFGLLPWPETGVKGLCLDKNGGTWVTTPTPAATDSRTTRKAELKLTDRGALEGKVTVTYTGLEALARRVTERNEDEASRKQYLEAELKAAVPTGTDVTLTNSPDWAGSTATLVAEFDFAAPGYASAAGSRELLQTGLFGATERHAFEHGNRVHPLYVSYPTEQDDDVELALPPGLRATSLPKPYDVDLTAVAYKSRVEEAAGKLRLVRELTVRYVFLPLKHYETIHDFYQQVRAGDEEQVVLSQAKQTAAH